MTTAIDLTVVVKKLKRFFGHFAQVIHVTSRLRSLIEYQSGEEEPEYLMLVGEPGTGKSTFLKWLVKQYPRIQHPEFMEIPILYVAVPANSNPKKLAGALLYAMDSPYWNKGDEEERTFQLRTLLKRCKTRMVIIDEANHLVDRGQAKSREAVADWIKVFSTQVCIPFVLSGIGRTRLLLEANDQLADRFREILELTPLGVGSDAQRKEFSEVIRAFQHVLGDIEHDDFSTDKVLDILAFATGGRLRAIRKLFVRSVEIIGEKPGRRLDLGVLEEAFLEIIFKKATPEQNPFSKTFRRTPLNKAGEPFAPSGR